MFRVEWVHSARAALSAQLWIDSTSDERKSITETINMVDQHLAIDPIEVGESREADRRILLMPPLVIKFKVEQRLRSVTIVDVWKFGRKR